MPKDVDGEGDVHVQVPVDDGRGAVQGPVDEGGGAVPVPVDEGGDVAKDVDVEGAVHVPVDEGAMVAMDNGPAISSTITRRRLDDLSGKKEDRRLLMAKQGYFDQGGEGVITKSAALRFSF